MSRAPIPRRRRSEAADPFILRSKLDRPNLIGAVLARPRLLQSLVAHADRPLSLVVSEAGFGKTILLASYAASIRRPVVWYSLMASDADAVVFGSYLLAGLRQEMPRQVRGLERTLEEARSGSGVSRFGTVLANALAARRGPPLLIVLDDFHEVAGDSAVTAMVDLLVRHMPPSARMLIGSRATPPLALDRMRSRGELFELDSSHLRFTRAELAQLFDEIYRMPLTDADVAALDEATLGWPTAVHLVNESLRRSPDRALESVLAEFRTSALELHDYLSHEVFARLEPDERRLLERLSAVERFDASLAAALSGLRDPRVPLQRLAHRGVLRSGPAATGSSSLTFPLPGSSGSVSSDWVNGVSTTGTIAWDFAIEVPTGAAEAYLPPTSSAPWRLEVTDGGYVNRSGRIEQYEIVWHAPSGDQSYVGAPLPLPTIEGQTVVAFVPQGFLGVPNVSTPVSLRAGPSPVRAGGSVTFVITGTDPGEARVFDLAGRLVANMPFVPQGDHWVARWNPSGGSQPARAGVYFARVGLSTARFVVLDP